MILKDSKRKSCTALIKLMQRLKKIHQKPQNKTNFEKSKQIKPKQYNQTKNHQQQKKN